MSWSSCFRRLRVPVGAALVLLSLIGITLPAVADDPPPLREARSVLDHVPDGYDLAAESAHLELHMDPQTAHIAVRDRRSRSVWLSTPFVPPTAEVSERRRSFLSSAFTIYLARYEAATAEQLNDGRLASAIRIEKGAYGATVYYDLEEFGVSFSLRYELGPDYLQVVVDAEDLVDTMEKMITAIDIMPYLGAVPYGQESQAQFVLPDGPGALTFVGRRHSDYRQEYSRVSYGPDYFAFARPLEQRTPIASLGFVFPELRTAVLQLVTEGAAESTVEARIGTEPTSFSHANLRLIYRKPLVVRTYSTGPSSGRVAVVNYYDRPRVGGDRAIRYFFLAGEEANWFGMAQRLRRYLVEERGLSRLQGHAAEPMLRLRLINAAMEPALFGRGYALATTFKEAGEILDAFHRAGVTSADVVLVGWGRGGYEGRVPRHWPPDRRLGGVRGLRELADAVHEQGGRLYLEIDYLLAFLPNWGFLPVIDTVVAPNRMPVTDLIAISEEGEVPSQLQRSAFLLNPLYARDRYVLPDTERLGKLGVDGLELRWAGEVVLKDANGTHPLERTGFAAAWRETLRTIKTAMGAAAAQGGNDYVLGVVDSVTQFPVDRSDYLFGDETVPFYPMATHGLVRIYGRGTNLDSDPERDRLRRLEYGMLPVYELSYRQPIALVRSTYPELHSSMYAEWVDRASEEHRALVVELGHTVNQFIVGHRELAPEVFETRYEDGTRVIVNYGDGTYLGDGVSVEPHGYQVIR